MWHENPELLRARKRTPRGVIYVWMTRKWEKRTAIIWVKTGGKKAENFGILREQGGIFKKTVCV
jgi:hypothetical protein